MTRGRGRGSIGRVGKSSVRSNLSIRANIPTVPIPTITSPQQVGTSSMPRSTPVIQTLIPPVIQTVIPNSTPVVQRSGQSSTPTIPEIFPITSNHGNPIGQDTSTQNNPIGEGASTQSNPIGEGDSSDSHARTLIFVTSTGLEPSRTCSSFISESFKNEVDPNGINWKGVSNEIRDGYFGEFKKQFYWDSSINEGVVRRQWEIKAATKYRDFISKRKASNIKPSYVPPNVWESWSQLWRDAKTVERSEINSKNRCSGRQVAAGTHTGGSVSIGEHRKRLAVEKGRDPTPSELHLHVHTHGHDGKSFVGERSRIVHERYEEILQEKIESQADIDQCEAYYEAAGGAKKKRIYGLGCEAKNYYRSNFFVSSGSNASSSLSPLVSQPAPTTNMSEFVMQLIPALTDHFLPIVLERVHEVISSPPTNNPSVVTPVVPPGTTNVEEEDHLVSDD